MKIIIAGSRYYDNYDEATAFIDDCINRLLSAQSSMRMDEHVFLSGGCSGADMIGERYAHEMGYEIKRYPAEWNKYGKKAGPVRNKQMIMDCDAVICFWDGKSRGTLSLIKLAEKYEKDLFIHYITNLNTKCDKRI